ncbi:MAG: thioredoxin domain-containing protein, partial [Microbacterium sp.]
WLGAGERYRTLAVRLVGSRAERARAEPTAHGALLRVCAQLAVPPRQLVLVGADPGDPLRAAAAHADAELVAFVSPAQAEAFAASGFTLFEGRGLHAGRAAAYDCHGFVCRLPVTEAAGLPRAR